MKFNSQILTACAIFGLTAAGPILKKRSGDADILNYALTLEHLEDTFYRQGLANFTESDFNDAGYDSHFYKNLMEVAYDEKTHVSFLTSALQAAGAAAVAECTYAFGVDSVETFIATASVLEGVGITAYLGAAAHIANPAYLTAAASILTVESRHNAYLRDALNKSPFPQAFDVPLDYDEVYSLAAPFIVSCPSSNPTFLTLKEFPGLTVSSQDAKIKTNTVLDVYANIPDDTTVYASFATVTGPVFAEIQCTGHGDYEVTVPAGVHGQSYLIFTSSNSTVNDDTTLAGPAIVEIKGTDGAPKYA
ncbi:hypothetical protein BT63DRAFT_101222 [Microthyrium microscopicum]|uniref:Uncharacterized protein n=1 Tax=Microthyrium microscopicum TaxID=703497 RepID=A0A6A6TY87_9PEZI|nr:hypothetical protein BT63DRAFT_101222 [Microthyrium microscopicum]